MGSKSGNKTSKIRNKIQKLKFCRFYRTCEFYSPESFTCHEGGGSYCGKFRKLEGELIV